MKKVKTGDKIIDNLYNAVIDYVESNGGNLAAVGGVSIVDEGRKFNYGIMVRVTGKKPTFDDYMFTPEGKRYKCSRDSEDA